MLHHTLPSPQAELQAFDSAVIELRTVRREPRMVFDELARTSFTALASLAADLVSAQLLSDTDAAALPPLRCSLQPLSPGVYMVGFEIPGASAGRLPRRRRRGERSASGYPPSMDEVVQAGLYGRTRILEELVLAVDMICSTPSGRLTVAPVPSGGEPVVELVDGVRVVLRVHRITWDLLGRPELQARLRAVLSLFRDPEMYTLALVQNAPMRDLSTNWVMTGSQRLSAFITGGALEMPVLDAG